MEHRAHLSDYRIDRHLLKQESDEERHALLDHLGQCKACEQKVSQLRLQQEQYRLPTELLRKAEDQVKTPVEPRSFLQGWWALSTISATAVLLLVVSTASLWHGPAGHFNPKGATTPGIWIALQRNEKIRIARSGETFYPKDKIRIAYRWNTRQKGYVFIVHRDARELSPLFPKARQDKSLYIQNNQQVELPGSFELDETTHGHEELWACFSRRPLNFQEVIRSLPPRVERFSAASGRRGHCQFLLVFLLKRGQ